MKKLYICIPTYNEAQNIIKLLRSIKEEQLRLNKDWSLGIIIIDDNSPDGTSKLVENFRVQNEDIEIDIIINPGKSGLGKAYVQGFTLGIEKGGDALLEMDADFSHDPKMIHTFLENIEKYDYVIGSRYIKNGGTINWSLKRKAISYFGNLYARIILWVNIQDFTGGYNCYKREVLEKINLGNIKSNGYAFQIELKYRSRIEGFKFTEIPILFKDRDLGKSKFNTNIVREAIVIPWKLRLINYRKSLN